MQNKFRDSHINERAIDRVMVTSLIAGIKIMRYETNHNYRSKVKVRRRWNEIS
jgi:hypothetical protein